MALTDPVSLGVLGIAAVTAAIAGWLEVPRRPALDAERWFKATFATLLRGRVEASGGDAAAWEAAVDRFIRYHPVGRFPERKLLNPAADPPGAWLDGERALHEALLQRRGIGERVAWLYRDDPVGAAARRADPEELGPAYRLGRAAGADLGWDAVAAWGAGDTRLAERLLQRLGARWAVCAEGAPLASALAREVGAVSVEAWSAFDPGPDGRWVLVCGGDAVADLLAKLVEAPGLRDRVVAVVSLGGAILGRSDVGEGPRSATVREDWMAQWYGQEHLDTEVVRLTPYMSVQWFDDSTAPPGVEGVPMQAARFPPPSPQQARVETIESVDLGPVPNDPELPFDLVARALLAVVCGWVDARR